MSSVVSLPMIAGRDQLLILCDCFQYFSSSIRFLSKQSSLFAGFFSVASVCSFCGLVAQIDD